LLVVAIALSTSADAARHSSQCNVTSVPRFINGEKLLRIELRKGAFCVHQYDLSSVERPDVLVAARPKRGMVVANGESLWGYRAPATAGSDRFTVLVGGRQADGSVVRTRLTYEVAVSE
jgi:hypothetical protein